MPSMAGTADVRPDWAPVAARIRDEATDDWDDTVAVERFERKGGRFVRGWGRLDGPGRVVVGDTGRTPGGRAGRDRAAGSRGAPPIDGLASTPTGPTARRSRRPRCRPRSLVVGGGAIGVELGQVFARFGSTVAVLEAAAAAVRRRGPESSELSPRCFGREGVEAAARGSIRRSGRDGRPYDRRRRAPPVVAERCSSRRGVGATCGARCASSGLDERARALPVDDRLRVGAGPLGGRRRHRRALHPRLDVPGQSSGGRHPRPGGRARRLPGAAPRHVHRPRDRLGGTERGAGGPAQGTYGARRPARLPESTPGWIHKAGNDGFIKLVEDADRASSWARPRRAPRGARCWAPSPRGPRGGADRAAPHMIYAYPTFHRAIEATLIDLARGA